MFCLSRIHGTVSFIEEFIFLHLVMGFPPCSEHRCSCFILSKPRRVDGRNRRKELLHFCYTSVIVQSNSNCKCKQMHTFGSFVNIVNKLWAGRPGFSYRQGPLFFLIATASRPAVGPTQPRSTGGSFPGDETG